MNGTSERVLVVAAHPDDEVLGCGATMARHAAEGDQVHVVFLAEGGAGSRLDVDDAEARAGNLSAIQAATQGAVKALGARPPVFLEFPDNRMDSLPLLHIVQRLEGVIAEVAPTVVYTHHAGDLNVDHRVAHQAVVTACRPQPGATIRAIYAFEVLSSTEWASSAVDTSFRPLRTVNVRDYMDAKRKALSHYQSEMRPFPHARSAEAVEALARLRGAQAGFEAGEAFMVIRELCS